MAIINPESTLEEKKAAAKLAYTQETQHEINMSFDNLVAVMNHRLNETWRHPLLTPQECCDALGTDAYELFKIGAIIKSALKAIRPDMPVFSPPMNVNKNEDGSVTLTPLN